MTKRIEIEAFLRWAYRDELPKAQKVASFLPAGFGGAWGGVERYGELLTVIDAPENDFGVVPDLGGSGYPHEDAIRVHEAVCALDKLPLELPADWNPLGDMPDFSGAAAAVAQAMARETYLDKDGQRWLKTTAGRLIRKHAILGKCPVWQADAPQEHVVCSDNGEPLWFRKTLVPIDDGAECLGRPQSYLEVEIDGMDRKRRIPHADAYRKTYFDPDPVEAVVARAEYEVWRAALDVLTIDLEEGLSSHVVLPSPRPWRPWETGDQSQGRVIPSLERPPMVVSLVAGSWGIPKPA